ncbi:MAG: release factor glutamine methyltransferase [Alphaproteobacteria bacterium]|nr:MAG: release factor glutamine methyltransferase [Caulobacteraceae bacterium]TPW06778.1 MAG: release factor glutamine methyltransferase [Alphaproteobacteria bacterium]
MGAMTLTLVVAWTKARRALEAAGVDLPVFDARLLLEAAAEVKRLDILTDPHRVVSPEAVARLDALVARRAAREPLAYILGTKAFWSLDFAVGPAVLTPRPDTETVVEAALAALSTDRPVRVLDLGVGSGAILLSILSARPLATGVGVDASADALVFARANADALGLAARASLIHGDWGQGLEGPFDLIVSNPPYIPAGEIAGLEPEVSVHEPRLALDGGADGLDAYRRLWPDVARLLTPGGRFAVEIGKGQGPDVSALAEAAGLEVEAVKPDLAGIGRVVLGRKGPF